MSVLVKQQPALGQFASHQFRSRMESLLGVIVVVCDLSSVFSDEFIKSFLFDLKGFFVVDSSVFCNERRKFKQLAH